MTDQGTPPRRRFDVDLRPSADSAVEAPASGILMVNASATGFRLTFAQDQLKLGKNGILSIALALPPQGLVKVRARLVWVHFRLKTAGFELIEGHPAYDRYIASLEQKSA